MATRHQAWLVATVATLTMTVSYIDRTTFSVLAPSVTKALDISESAYGWLTTAFSIAYLFATPLAGWWIDRAGARRGLVWSVFAWSMVAALHAVAPGFGTLFVLRVALGFTEGPSFPGAVQTVQRVLPPESRSRGLGMVFTGSSIGAMIVPPLASAMYDAWGWQAAFLGTTLVGLAWIPLWIAVTNPVRAQLDAPPDEPVKPRASFAQLLASPRVARGFVAVLAISPVVGFIQAWGAKYLVRAHHLKQGEVGHYLWVPPLVFDACAILFGDRAARWYRRTAAPPRMYFAIGAACACGVALLPLADTPWTAIAICSLALGGAGATYPLITGDLLRHLPVGSSAYAGGLIAGGQSLALIVWNPIIGHTVDAYASYDVAAIAIALWVLPGALLWLLWTPRR